MYVNVYFGQYNKKAGQMSILCSDSTCSETLKLACGLCRVLRNESYYTSLVMQPNLRLFENYKNARSLQCLV